MSLSDRRFALLFPLLLACCGFQSAYSPSGSASKFYNKVNVQAANDHDSFLLMQELEDRIGSSGNQFELQFDLTIESDASVVIKTGETARFSVLGTVNYILKDNATTRIVGQGQIKNFTSYSAAGSTVETRAAKQDAHARLMRVLADQIANHLVTADIQ